MESKLVLKQLDELPIIAEKILNFDSNCRVFTFYGELGSGKTTIIKAICEYLHVVDQTSSPSFNILHEYRTKQEEPVYHFDFYRIKKLEEVFDLGFESYINGENYCFIEWPEMLDDLLDMKHVKVKIDVDHGHRLLMLSV